MTVRAMVKHIELWPIEKLIPFAGCPALLRRVVSKSVRESSPTGNLFIARIRDYLASSTGMSDGGSPAANILAESKKPATVKWNMTSFLPLFCQNQP
jgi:hypothetical protein